PTTPRAAPMHTTIDVTVVIPVFGSTASLDELVARITETLNQVSLKHEVIFVEDGGPIDNWSHISELALHHGAVQGLRLSRNFGQQEAIAAGIAEASGDVVIVMDCDLQDPPECIPRLLHAIENGADIAIGTRAVEPAGALRNAANHLYYWFLSKLSGYQVDPQQGTFSAVRRKVVDAYLSLGDLDRPYRLVLDWLGFDVARVQFERQGRTDGKSTYSLIRLIRFALSGVVFQSTRLLYGSIVAGIVTSATAFGLGLYFIIRAFSGNPPEGWASSIVITLMLGGVILMAIGVMGVYLGKVFEQTRGRPMYIVRDRIGQVRDQEAFNEQSGQCTDSPQHQATRSQPTESLSAPSTSS
ncbi:MAG: glycosyltransferase family 2 protein, partial [Phycisphaerales bacterium]|nr:glycosyltransferase family 2 protein [Phycisphaerales bacterium]